MYRSAYELNLRTRLGIVCLLLIILNSCNSNHEQPLVLIEHNYGIPVDTPALLYIFLAKFQKITLEHTKHNTHTFEYSIEDKMFPGVIEVEMIFTYPLWDADFEKNRSNIESRIEGFQNEKSIRSVFNSHFTNDSLDIYSSAYYSRDIHDIEYRCYFRYYSTLTTIFASSRHELNEIQYNYLVEMLNLSMENFKCKGCKLDF